MEINNQEELVRIHKHSDKNKIEILHSKYVGCFYCKTIFDRTTIDIPFQRDGTADCPYCGIDSLIGDSEIPLTMDLMIKLNKKFFSSRNKYE